MRITTVGLFIVLFLFTSVNNAIAQSHAPGMKWQKIIGGGLTDDIVEGNKISLVDHDGGYVVGMETSSNDRDITGNHADTYGFPSSDIWVAKLDTQRNVQWSASIGGTGSESFGSLQLAHDSGYIVVGSTTSNDYDVSGNHGQNDIWVVRLGTRGNIVWKKCYGGSQDDYGSYIEKTNDGYILLGFTSSNDGDVSGLHGTNSDIWVAKTDKQGNLLWEKCFGSHGYVAYRIKPLSTVHAGDTIKNTAGIYFDYNMPVATNTEKTIVFIASSTLPVTLISFQATQAGAIVNVSWKTSAELNAKYFEVQRSANGIDFITIGTVPAGNTTYLLKDNSPLEGYNYYRLKPVDIDGGFTYSTIVMVNMKNGAEVISSLYPNPGNGNVTLKL
jgi:hypothetical protein